MKPTPATATRPIGSPMTSTMPAHRKPSGRNAARSAGMVARSNGGIAPCASGSTPVASISTTPIATRPIASQVPATSRRPMTASRAYAASVPARDVVAVTGPSALIAIWSAV